jgi:tetratricopeptide (TPR) repeat protein
MKATRNAPGNINNPGDDKPGGGARDWLLAVALVLATVLAYHPVLRAGFIWDDDKYVTENPLLTAPDGLRRIWFSLESPSQYFPLTYTTFYFERLCWGVHPAGYHVLNLLLHAANALLAWRLLAWLRLPGAWLAAALFALHPVQVESVAWITERKNVLMGFFFLLSLLAWTRFIDEFTKRPWRFYGLALVLYALALSAKTTACTLPAALWLVLWLKKKPIGWRRWAQLAPFVALGIGMGLVTVLWERFHQGTQGAVFSISPLQRVLIASRALWFYAGKLLWPANLTFSYPRWSISASDPFAYGWLLAAAAMGWAIWRARRWAGRGVEVAAVYFAATLSPVLGFIMLWTFLYSFVADHYQYLACLGPLALAGAGFERGLGWVAKGTPLLKPMCCAVWLTILGALTCLQCRQYADAETLWSSTVARNPGSFLAQNNLGVILLNQGKTDEATRHLKMAVDIQPDFAEGQYDLGMALSQQGAVVQAIAHYRMALAIHSDFAEARNNLGIALVQQGEMLEGIAQLQKALEIKPNYSTARKNLGLALLRKGDLDGAMACLERTTALPPDPAQKWYHLGNGLLQERRFLEAIVCYRQALSISPRFADAWAYLGLACFQNGQTKESVESWQKALDINPLQPEVQNNMATVLATASDASLRDGPKAVALGEQANQATGGGNPRILSTLAAAYAEAGRYDEATATARKALILAEAQKDDKLARALQEEIQLYKAGHPMRKTK